MEKFSILRLHADLLVKFGVTFRNHHPVRARLEDALHEQGIWRLVGHPLPVTLRPHPVESMGH